MEQKRLKLIGYILTAILVLNLLLVGFQVYSWTIFWIVLVLGAVFVYFVLPKLKE